jgi:aarF domain-containing kinase
MRDLDEEDNKLYSQVKRALRMIRRLFKLMVVFSPVFALYPFHWIYLQGTIRLRARDAARNAIKNGEEVDAQDIVLDSLEQGKIPDGPVGWYYKLCLCCVEWSGAACIKIMQWAGSRPDIFGRDFCAVFSQLQDDTTPHAWRYTEEVLVDAYGENWKDHVKLGEILGSGCIAQVYKGTVYEEDGTEKLVAVKIMHPNVEDDIDADLDIMRLAVRTLERFNAGPLRNLKWLNLPGFVEEMAVMLKIQLDLRSEGDHLVQFNKNFKGNEHIVFPKLVEGYSPKKHVLIETFCEGVPIMEFIKNNKADRTLLSSMCAAAIGAVCQMIFLGECMRVPLLSTLAMCILIVSIALIADSIIHFFHTHYNYR